MKYFKDNNKICAIGVNGIIMMKTQEEILREKKCIVLIKQDFSNTKSYYISILDIRL